MLTPTGLPVTSERGRHLLKQKDFEAAEQVFRALLQQDHPKTSWSANLALALKGQGRLTEAAGLLEAACTAAPHRAPLYYNLGNVYRDLDAFDAAEQAYQRTLELDPDHAKARMNLGLTAYDREQFDAAAQTFTELTARVPGNAEAHMNLGHALRAAGQFDAAAGAFEKAVSILPENVNLRLLAFEALQNARRLDRAWPHYEWRLKSRESYAPELKLPRWAGEPFDGKTLLILAEQGLGDQVQFVRYAALAKRRGGTVVAQGAETLVNLLATCPGVDCAVPRHIIPAGVDLVIPVASLPAVFATNVDTVPDRTPYLFAEADRTARWRNLLAGTPGLKVGLNWEGNRNNVAGRPRAVPLKTLNPLGSVPGARFFSIQIEHGRDQLGDWTAPAPLTDLGRFVKSYDDTAALMVNLDLIITNDTSVAHVAAALGKPVWMLLPTRGCWRWIERDGRSLWYPTLRVFRQHTEGDWEPPVHEVTEALRHAVIHGLT
ncbi:MAG: tetratricopeptide repeat-containing glycosyltransferase family protein [Bacteroidota bacterium]